MQGIPHLVMEVDGMDEKEVEQVIANITKTGGIIKIEVAEKLIAAIASLFKDED